MYSFAALLAVAATACAAGTPRSKPLSAYRERHEFRYIVTFGVIPETVVPPGYVPSPPGKLPFDPVPQRRINPQPLAPGRTGLVTLVVFGQNSTSKAAFEKEIGRIEHVDATVPIYEYPPFSGSASALQAFIYVPVVGPRGEHLTRIFHWTRKGIDPESFLPVGGAIPRVVRFSSWDYQSGEEIYFAFGIPVPDRPGLFLPVGKEPIALPAGVVGATPVTTHDERQDWTGWFVRWEGANGTGWSFVKNRVLEGFTDTGPRWITATATRVPGGRAVVGQLVTGGCEVVMAQTDSNRDAHHIGRGYKAGTCDDAARALVARVAFERAEREAKSAAERAAAKARLDEADARKAQWERDHPKWVSEREKLAIVEQPIKTAYHALVKQGKVKEACAEGMKLTSASHTELVLSRFADFRSKPHHDELVCVYQRTDLPHDARASLDRAEETRDFVDSKQVPGSAGGGGSGGATGSGGAGQSHADKMKSINDYLYGSGRSSGCPFADRSLC